MGAFGSDDFPDFISASRKILPFSEVRCISLQWRRTDPWSFDEMSLGPVSWSFAGEAVVGDTWGPGRMLPKFCWLGNGKFIWRILLMVQNSGKLTSGGNGSWSHDLQSFVHAGWCRISSINSIILGTKSLHSFSRVRGKGRTKDISLTLSWNIRYFLQFGRIFHCYSLPEIRTKI